MNYTFRPLRWTEPSTPANDRRSRWTFRADWSDTLVLLERELDLLDARDIVIEADFTEGDIRLDGMPRANARQPVHPGVRIAFDSKHGPLVYSTDSCERWQHNVRSIALGLEALRAVDRYGVTKRGEQYTGWKALAAAPAPMTRLEAWIALCHMAGYDKPQQMLVADAEDQARVDATIRRARRAAHPDTGGSNEQWHQFTRAHRAFLGAVTTGGH